jgi:hypothetical protein
MGSSQAPLLVSEVCLDLTLNRGNKCNFWLTPRDGLQRRVDSLRIVCYEKWLPALFIAGSYRCMNYGQKLWAVI